DYAIDTSAASNSAFVDMQAAGTFEFSRVRVVAGVLGIGVYAAHGVACVLRRGFGVDGRTYSIDATAAAASYPAINVSTSGVDILSNSMASAGFGSGVGVIALANRTT